MSERDESHRAREGQSWRGREERKNRVGEREGESWRGGGGRRKESGRELGEGEKREWEREREGVEGGDGGERLNIICPMNRGGDDISFYHPDKT